jgi:hypothetical protein
MDVGLMAVLSWGSSGAEVRQLQQQLKNAGFYPGPVDGKFGPLTFSAVKRFQQSQGLVVDGIAGPKTIAALAALGHGAPAAGQAPATGATVSLHIGINRVDPSKYGGWDGALAGCENDARTMAAIAAAEGFSVRHLVSPAATAATILDEVRRVARSLSAGGTFLLTYAGHGGQVADLSGEEEDQKDETWVAYDRQIIDDELSLAFGEFPAGTNIIVVSDSCHSGTVYRYVRGPGGFRAARDQDVDKEFQREFAELKLAFYEDLAVARPGPGEPPFVAFPRPADGPRVADRVQVRTAAIATAGSTGTSSQDASLLVGAAPYTGGSAASRGQDGEPEFAVRAMPITVNEAANEVQHEELVEAKRKARSRPDVAAAGILLSGCADNQLSQEVNGAGVFTTILNRTWANGSYIADYQRYIAQIVSQMGPTQTPQLSAFGGNVHLLLARTPFRAT